jgi:uncharacterized protein (TIGR02996 family)
MTHDEAFLQAIRENPEDDGPRLVYADWLEEQGRPERAELVPVQCELARLEPDAPRYPALCSRERELLDRHGKEWSKPLRRYARVFTFRRGFPDHATLPLDTFLRHADEIFAIAPLWHVKLREVKYRTTDRVPELADCLALARVSSLDLDTNNLGVGQARTLFSSPHVARLTALDLTNNSVGVSGTQALANSPHLSRLTRLHVGSNKVADNGLRALVESPMLARLRTLGLHGNGLSAAGVEALALSPQAAGLEELDLSLNGRAFPGAARFLAGSPYLPRLHTLNLGHNGALTEEDLVVLANAPGLPALKNLSLANCRFNPMNALVRGPRPLAGAEGFTSLVLGPLLGRLRSLDLSNNYLGLPGAAAVAASPQAANLVCLRLEHCHFEDDAAAALAGSPYLARLAVLNLADNAIGDAGARELASSPHLKCLHTLVIDTQRNMTEVGRRALRDRFGPDAVGV